MSMEKAREYLRERGLEDRIRVPEAETATVASAAAALGVTPGEIAKTLSFLAEGRPVLVLAAGDARIDNSRFKAAFHTKAKMIPPEEVEALVGHAPGGVCPFGVREDTEIYLDESLRRYERVYPAAGDARSAVELTIPELESALDHPAWVLVTKDAGQI